MPPWIASSWCCSQSPSGCSSLLSVTMAMAHLLLCSRVHPLKAQASLAPPKPAPLLHRHPQLFRQDLRHPCPSLLLLAPCRPSLQAHNSNNDNLVANDEGDHNNPLAPTSATGPPVPEPEPEWAILERWNVPWDGTTTVAGMLSWLFSFLLTGLAVSIVAAQLGIGQKEGLDLDEQATFILFHQLAQTAAGLGALSFVLGRYKPLPPQLFSYDFGEPFDLRRGWILFGGLGLAGAAASVVAASMLIVNLMGQPPPREEADALLQLLPIIGASPASTASLIFVTGVLAPLLEETVFRGFFLTSLTKWLPTPVAIVVSACAFAGAHLTPGEFPQLVALGIVLGLAYAQTRTLVTPMLIHSLWNSGVIILLTILRLQGLDIKELL